MTGRWHAMAGTWAGTGGCSTGWTRSLLGDVAVLAGAAAGSVDEIAVAPCPDGRRRVTNVFKDLKRRPAPSM
jgi:hypothetical protein